MSWPTVTLREETSLITKGTTPTSLGHAFTDRGVPFLRAQNLVGGTVSVEADPMFVSSDTNDALKRSKIRANDVLISIAGTIGRAAIVPSEALEMNCNQAVAIVRPSDKVDRKFLLYWLSSNDALSQMSKGKVTGVISNLSLGQIGQLKIPLPPLEEQRRIAAILDQADALRRLRRRALDRLNTLGQAIFHEMFGDPFEAGKSNQICELKDLTTRITYGFTSPMSHHLDGIPILTAKSVQNGFIDYSSCKYAIQHEFDALTDKSKPERGDLLITKDGTIGRYSVFNETFPVCINQSVALVKPDFEKIVPEYLAAYVGSSGVQRRFQGMKKGNALPHLQITELANFPIFAPSFNDQLELKKRLSSVDELRVKLIKGEEITDALFASLQYRAFRGEL